MHFRTKKASKKEKKGSKNSTILTALVCDYKLPFPPKIAQRIKEKTLYMDEGKKGGHLYIYFLEPKSETAVEVEAFWKEDGSCEIPIPIQFLGCVPLLYSKLIIDASFKNGIKISPGKKSPETSLEPSDAELIKIEKELK